MMSRHKLPVSGKGWPNIRAQMDEAHQADRPWHHERTFLGGSYYGGEEVLEIANESFGVYLNHNALFAAKMYPSLVRYETEVVEMLLDLLNAPESATGSITSGGTESLLLTVKTVRDWALDRRPEVQTPEMVLPHATHPGFDKAAHLMGVKAVRMSASVDYRADVDAMARAITDNTVMLVASAPSYPFGVTDSVTELAALAERHRLWLHVDACHGGFVLPFARKLGYPVPEFDFSLPGVTSMSIDIHKLGYANKGVSTLLLRDAELQAYQRYEFSDWPAGVYATSGITGSRSGGGLASAWAVMNTLGESGYLAIVEPILRNRERLVKGINAIDGLEVWGNPDAYLVSFGSTDFDVFALADGMSDKGWWSNRLANPPSIHLFLDAGHETSIDAYLADLASVSEVVKTGALQSRGTSAVYST